MAAAKNRRVRATQTRDNGAVGADVSAPGIDTASRADDPAGAVWDALTVNAGASIATIAMAAGVSKSAARRELAALEKDGRATRTKGGRDGGKPAPDTWAPVTDEAPDDTTDNTADVPADDAASTVSAQESGAPDALQSDDGSAVDDAAPPASDDGDSAASPPDSDQDGKEPDSAQEGMDPAAVAEASDALTAMRDVIDSALGALDAGDGEKAVTEIESVYGASGKARRLVRIAARGRPRSASGQAKSLPGQLRGKVAAHLAAYPDKEFTPHEIGKAINHSAGAVANALDRLVGLGEAVCTSERPRRFTSATPAADKVAVGATETTATS
jgi:hypothetical protein